MKKHDVDVCVIGSGFAGSLMAMVLRSEGRSVTLIDKGHHPRFAIGESSTPLANFKLREIADRYDLPQLKPLTRYGDWMKTRPELMRGPKRGFSYFYHETGKPFVTDADHRNQLLVTANSSIEKADLHWLREDMDAFLVDEAKRMGVKFLDGTTLEAMIERDDGIELSLSRDDVQQSICTRFVVIASGNGQVWQPATDGCSQACETATCSRAIYAHFAGVRPWADVMRELSYSVNDHPFACDQSALHHVFDGGWMWQLRFDDDTTSAGFMLDARRYAYDDSMTPEDEWNRWLEKFPSIKRQFADSFVVRPVAGVQRSRPLQKRSREIIRNRWAKLPTAAGFSDPLFSTGIGHSLFAVDRLAMTLRQWDGDVSRKELLKRYEASINDEIDWIDRLVSMPYRASESFQRYVSATMPYFAAATWGEQDDMEKNGNQQPGFLSCEVAGLSDAVADVERTLAHFSDKTSLADEVSKSLQRFDRVGLLSEATTGMVRYSAAE